MQASLGSGGEQQGTYAAGREAEDWERAGRASRLPGCAWPCACRRPSGCSGWAARSPRAGAAGAARAFPFRAPEKTGLPVAAEGLQARAALVDPAHSELQVQPHRTAPWWENAASPEIAITSNYFPT